MKKKQRLHFILFIMACMGAAVGISLYALQDNISFFYSPMEIKGLQNQKSAAVSEGRVFRLGGLVKEGSLSKSKDDISISFIVTDDVNEMRVEYSGILPDLFREGQGVVATGHIDMRGVFIATNLLARHDENYMPPEVAKSLEKAAREKRNK